MQNKVIILIVLLLICLIALLSVSFVLMTIKNQPIRQQQQIIEEEKKITTMSLTLFPDASSVHKQQPNRINILLDVDQSDEQPRIIQIELAYDPHALSDIVLTPGPYFSSPTVLFSEINQNTGRISYALSGNPDPRAAQKTVATITFIPNETFQGSETTIRFLPKSMIRGTSETNLLTTTYGTKLYFATASAQPTQ